MLIYLFVCANAYVVVNELIPDELNMATHATYLSHSMHMNREFGRTSFLCHARLTALETVSERFGDGKNTGAKSRHGILCGAAAWVNAKPIRSTGVRFW
jgi:hypothetical protein